MICCGRSGVFCGLDGGTDIDMDSKFYEPEVLKQLQERSVDSG